MKHTATALIVRCSCARGGGRPGSDYDVAVYPRDMADRFAEMDRLAKLATDICDQTGEIVHAMPYRAGSCTEYTPLMLGIRTEGMLANWPDEAGRAAYLAESARCTAADRRKHRQAVKCHRGESVPRYRPNARPMRLQRVSASWRR
jgi:hypothetical protein